MRLKVAIDCDMSSKLVGVMNGLFGQDGFEFHHVSDLAPPKTEDEHWADIFKRFGGHVVLSADGRIAFKPHKAIAFIDNGFISFFMQSPWQVMRGNLEAAHLIYLVANNRREDRGARHRDMLARPVLS